MIRFIQKQYTEYDAMKSLYEEIKRNYNVSSRVKVIDKSSLIPILKGNNVVIERFVINTSTFGKDRFRMYLKIGAKAKLPDEVRLPAIKQYDKPLFNFKMNFSSGIPLPKIFSEYKTKMFKGGGGEPKPSAFINTGVEPGSRISIDKKITELLGDAISYNKKDRSLVLEFNEISDAIRALNILPFGLEYNLYLLDA